MTAAGFRFDPPQVAVSPALRWVLARAFAAGDTTLVETEGGAAVDMAERFALAARIAAVQPQERLAGELGAEAAARLLRQRALAVAHQMRLDAALAVVDGVAADLRIPYAPLKGQALVLGGFARDGGRSPSNLELLVPEGRRDVLQQALLRREFVAVGEAGEHQAAALCHAGGGRVDLHRVLPSVRVDPRRPATYETLFAAGLIGPPQSAMSLRPRGDLRLPRREFLTAHAVVETIAQHGFAPAIFPGFLFLGDLVDLAFRGSGGRATLSAIIPWIEHEVSYEEAAAALDLATALAGTDAALFAPAAQPEAQRSPARRLLDHILASVVDPTYELARERQRERPLFDKPQAGPLPKSLARSQGESLLARLRQSVRRWVSVRAADRRR